MVDPDAVFAAVIAGVCVVALLAVPHLVLRRLPRRSKRPVTNGLAVRPQIPAPPLDTAHRW